MKRVEIVRPKDWLRPLTAQQRVVLARQSENAIVRVYLRIHRVLDNGQAVAEEIVGMPVMTSAETEVELVV